MADSRQMPCFDRNVFKRPALPSNLNDDDFRVYQTNEIELERAGVAGIIEDIEIIKRKAEPIIAFL